MRKLNWLQAKWGAWHLVFVPVTVMVLTGGYYSGSSRLQQILFAAQGDALYAGYRLPLSTVFLGCTLASFGVIVGWALIRGEAGRWWKVFLAYGMFLSATYAWLAPAAMLTYLKVSGDAITVSEFSGFHQIVSDESYASILYVVPDGSSVDIYFQDGVVFRGINNLKDFSDRYRSATGKGLKVYYQTANGIQPFPDSAEPSGGKKTP